MQRILLSLALLLSALAAFAQSTNVPQSVNFQAVARDPNGNILANTAVYIRLTVRQGGAAGTPLYCALHQELTNAYGSFSIQLNQAVQGQGCNGAPLSAFETIPWENGNTWIQVEYQPGATQAWVDLGAIELNSTFYAFVARRAETLTNMDLTNPLTGQVIQYNGTKWVPTSVGGITPLTAGTGIGISGGTISNTGDLSNTNEIQSLSVSGNQVTISGANTITVPGVNYTAGAGVNINGSTLSAQTTTPQWNANQLQSSPVSSQAPQTGQYLQWNGTAWVPVTLYVPGGGSGSNPNTLIYTTSGF